MTSHNEFQQYSTQLRARERELLRELEEGKQRAAADTFEQVAGEARDAGDDSVADLVTDGLSAQRERGSDELREVQDALGRIADGSYGLCQSCGEPIDTDRLQAMPTARYDIAHQEEAERLRGAPSPPTL